jgi:hypothetical protein
MFQDCLSMVAKMQITPPSKKGAKEVSSREVWYAFWPRARKETGHAGKQSCNDERHVTAHGDSISLQSSAAEMSCTAAGHGSVASTLPA